MNITFDSNVWEAIIDEKKHRHVEIKNKILGGKIHPYICEINLDLEAIQKKERAEFFGDYEPSITVEDLPPENGKFRMRIGIASNTELHPGLPLQQWDKLLKARDLGFQVLRMVNAGTVRTTDIPDNMYVEPDDIKEYAELLGNCNDFITELGCGRAAYDQFKAQFDLVGSGGQPVPDEQKKKFGEAIAEWVDGEALSAHYASGNDYFCTDDKAKNAGTASIFHKQNKNRLIEKFGIKIISSCEAAELC